MDDDVIEGLNRSAKLFIDNGAASTVEEAVERLQGFRMHLVIGEVAARDPTHQAALLTALNCGRRTFLGGITVSGDLNAPLVVPIVPGATLKDAVLQLQGQITKVPPEGVPLVVIGAPAARANGFAIRTTFQGWRAGVVPVRADGLAEAAGFAPAGVLAGALAVAEVFAHLNGEAMAGYREVGISLWDVAALDWRAADVDGPMPDVLPSDFWVIGLGHLGQAFLWTIGLLPYSAPDKVRLYLQDTDVAGGSTESTSVLTFARDQGEMKTRICAAWATARGFSTRLVERRFGSDLTVCSDEPALALCGVDNPQARALLEGAGFATVFEAGLGNGTADFRLIRTHSFPAPITASQVWADDADQTVDVAASRQLPAAYEELRDRGGLDQCGLTRLAEVAVGAPFVGMVVAAVLIAQVTRFVVDGRRPTVLNLDLGAPQHRRVVMRDGVEAVIFRNVPA